MDRNRLPRQTLNTDQKEDGTLDDRRRDGGTNSTLRTKEKGTHLTLNEHDDDDENGGNIVLNDVRGRSCPVVCVRAPAVRVGDVKGRI